MTLKQYNYDIFAQYYDVMDGSFIPYEKAARKIQDTLKLKNAKILDMACGTGSFTIALRDLGHDVEGMDYSPEMLQQAKHKAPDLRFSQHDMRKPVSGSYDLISCMFNSVGHLTKQEFEVTLRNFHDHTRYIVFDIFNFDFMNKNFRTYKFIDAMYNGPVKIVRFNKNSLDRKKHIMHINQETWFQEQDKPVEIVKGRWDMQIYTRDEIDSLLANTGYELSALYGGFDECEGMVTFNKESSSLIVFAQVK